RTGLERSRCEGGRRGRTMYFDTVACETARPSFSSSPWILGASQSGLARLIRVTRTFAARREGPTSGSRSPKNGGRRGSTGRECGAIRQRGRHEVRQRARGDQPRPHGRRPPEVCSEDRLSPQAQLARVTACEIDSAGRRAPAARKVIMRKRSLLLHFC